MELCDMNLDNFIYQALDWGSFCCPDHPEYLRDEDSPIWWRTGKILQLMFQITNGVAFIHKNNQVHRDLKPQNS
jgi:serine/threonine protein kinase